jgi:hypothetical protein
VGLKVDWRDASKTCIVFTVTAPWTWDEMYAGIDLCYVMMGEVDHTVATLFDVRKASGMPPSALANLRNLNRRRHDNSGKVIVIGLAAFHRSILNIFAGLYGFSNPNGVHFVASLEAADALLAASDARV